MEKVETTKATVKGNKTTEGIIGAAALKLESAVKSLNEAVTAAAQISSTVEQGTLQVVNLEDQIESLKTTLEQKKKDSKIELELDFKNNQEEFAKKYMATKKLVPIEIEELQKLQNKLNSFQTDFDKQVAAESGKAKGMLESLHRQR